MSTPFVAGTSTVITWTTSSGTTTFSADYRTVDWKPSTEFVDGTGGGDTVKTKIPGMKDATCDITMRNPTGTSGTSLYSELQPGKQGTLVFQPQGTATNYRKITFPSYCNGANYSNPYNDISIITVTFQANGSFTDGVNT